MLKEKICFIYDHHQSKIDIFSSFKLINNHNNQHKNISKYQSLQEPSSSQTKHALNYPHHKFI